MSDEAFAQEAVVDVAFPAAKLGVRLIDNAVTWVSPESKKLGVLIGMKMVKVAGINVVGVSQDDAIKIIKANKKRPLNISFRVPKDEEKDLAVTSSSLANATATNDRLQERTNDDDAKREPSAKLSDTNSSNKSVEDCSNDTSDASKTSNDEKAPSEDHRDASEPEEGTKSTEEAADSGDVEMIMKVIRKLKAQRIRDEINDEEYRQTVESLDVSDAVLKKVEMKLEEERLAAKKAAEMEAAAFEAERLRTLTRVQNSLVFKKGTAPIKLLDDEEEGGGESTKNESTGASAVDENSVTSSSTATPSSSRHRRRLVLEGEMERFRSSHSVFVSALRDMYLFLLSDMLIVADRKKSLYKKGFKKGKNELFTVTYEVEEVIPLDKTGIVTLADLKYTNEKHAENTFSIQSTTREHRFVAPDSATKEKWLGALKNQILALTPKEVIDSMIGYEHMIVNGTFFSACMIGRTDILKKLVALSDRSSSSSSSSDDHSKSTDDVSLNELDLNSFDSQGFTPLHYAAHTGNVACMRILCSCPRVLKDVASKRPEHDMPIHMTAGKEHAECTEMLLEAGASASVRDAMGRTALDLVVPKAVLQASKDHGSHRCVEIILKHRGRVGAHVKNATGKSAQETLRNEDPLRMFRDIGSGDALLMRVASNASHQAGAHHVVRALIDAGAAVNQHRPKGGQTALHLACASPNRPPTPDLLAALLRAGAEPNLVDDNLNTPMHYLFMSRIKEFNAARRASQSYVPPKSTILGNAESHVLEQRRKTAIQTLLSHGARIDVENKIRCMVKQILRADELSLYEKIYANWQSRKPPHQTSDVNCLRDAGAFVAREDRQVDDADSSRCQLCGLMFSTFTRRHHCRSTGLLVCWYCSTQSFPLIRDGIDVPQFEKVSDGQFNKLLWNTSRWKPTREKKPKVASVVASSGAGGTTSDGKSRTDIKAQSANAMREEMRNASSTSKKSADAKREKVKSDPKAKAAASGLDGTRRGAQKALERLNKRTQKLNDTALAAERLADSADEFENMARMLEERENKKFFGLGKFF